MWLQATSALCVMDVWALSCKTLQTPVVCVLPCLWGGCNHLCATCATTVMHQHIGIVVAAACCSAPAGVWVLPWVLAWVGMFVLGVSHMVLRPFLHANIVDC